MEYTNITFEDLLSNFKTNLTSDDRFKHINSATIYGMFMEMLTFIKHLLIRLLLMMK